MSPPPLSPVRGSFMLVPGPTSGFIILRPRNQLNGTGIQFGIWGLRVLSGRSGIKRKFPRASIRTAVSRGRAPVHPVGRRVRPRSVANEQERDSRRNSHKLSFPRWRTIEN